MKSHLSARELARVKQCVSYLKRIGEGNSITWQSIAARPALAGDFCDRVETDAANRRDKLIGKLRG